MKKYIILLSFPLVFSTSSSFRTFAKNYNGSEYILGKKTAKIGLNKVRGFYINHD